MAQYNFEGDFENINDRQLLFINNVISEQDLQVKKVVFEPVGKAGDNFVANVKRIKIEGGNGSMKMIVKVAAADDVVRKATNIDILFNNEHVMYTQILPKMVQMQKDAGVPEEQLLRYAKCYGSLNEAPNEIILLEDLNESGFAMLNKFVSLSDECVKSILKNFAVLHSFSYTLKEKEKETFNDFKSKLIDVGSVMAANPEISVSMRQLENDVISILDDESHKSKVKNKVAELFTSGVKILEKNREHFIIQQGDAWTNNIMFRFLGDNVPESVMIDYQASHLNKPVADIFYMIFICTDHETRLKYFYSWIDHYHAELDKSLSIFGLKATSVYSKDQLYTDLKEFANLLFGLSIMLINIVMRDSKEACDFVDAIKNSDQGEKMATTKIQDLQTDSTVRLKKRIIGIIDSFDAFGLF